MQINDMKPRGNGRDVNLIRQKSIERMGTMRASLAGVVEEGAGGTTITVIDQWEGG